MLKGMQFALWKDEKEYRKGKAPVENVSLNYRTEVHALGKKMGKAFCIVVNTSGSNEAFWAKNTEDQNAWIDALRRACQKPEEPKQQLLLQQQPSSHESKQDIQIQVHMPGQQQQQQSSAMDPAYQQQLLQYQQQQLQYQQQMAAYNAQLMAAGHPPMPVQPPAPMQPSSYSQPMAQAQPMAYPPVAAAQPMYPNVNDANYWNYSSPAASPAMPRKSPTPPPANSNNDNGGLDMKMSPYGKF